MLFYLSLKEFDYVLAIAEYKNISLAARSLFISQPALSRFIINLEGRVGMKLFIRHGKTIEMTEAGKSYLRYAREIARQRDLLISEMDEQFNKNKFALRIGFMPYSGKSLVPEAIKRLCKKYPNTDNVHISEKVSSQVEQGLLDGDLDLGFVGTPTTSAHLEYETVFSEYVLLAIHKESSFAQKGVKKEGIPYPWIDASLLQKAKFIATEKGMRSRKALELLFKQEGISPTIATTTNSSYTALEFSESGAGICLTFDSSFFPFLKDKKDIQLFCVGNPVMKMGVGFAYRNRDNLSPVARDFIRIYQSLHSRFCANLPCDALML